MMGKVQSSPQRHHTHRNCTGIIVGHGDNQFFESITHFMIMTSNSIPAFSGTFKENLAMIPSVENLVQLSLIEVTSQSIIGTIENKPGQAASAAIYWYLSQHFGTINIEAAQTGLTIYAEHTQDALQNPGKHPNIDRLLGIVNNGQAFLKVSAQWST